MGNTPSALQAQRVSWLCLSAFSPVPAQRNGQHTNTHHSASPDSARVSSGWCESVASASRQVQPLCTNLHHHPVGSQLHRRCCLCATLCCPTRVHCQLSTSSMPGCLLCCLHDPHHNHTPLPPYTLKYKHDVGMCVWVEEWALSKPST